MFIAKVVGNLWATRKHKSLVGAKLLLVQPVDGITGARQGETLLAVDKHLSAGVGDVVLVMDEGNSARQILGDKKAPVRTIICGVIDYVSSDGKVQKWH